MENTAQANAEPKSNSGPTQPPPPAGPLGLLGFVFAFVSHFSHTGFSARLSYGQYGGRRLRGGTYNLHRRAGNRPLFVHGQSPSE